MIISEQLVEEVNGFGAHKALVLRIYEGVPWFLRVARQKIVILRIQLDIVLVKILEKLLSPQNLGDLDQLVCIAVSMEERLLAEDHRGEHGAQRPHVQRVIVFLVINQQFRSLEVP